MRVGKTGTDDQVSKPIAVDIARRGDRAAAKVVRRHTAELEAVAAIEGGKVDIRGKAGRLAEHDIARAGIATIWVGACGPDNQIVEAVAVDVTSRRDRPAAIVVRRQAEERESVAAVKAGKVDVAGKA